MVVVLGLVVYTIPLATTISVVVLAPEPQLVNTCLREQGSHWFDAVFEFATPLASTDDEAVLHPAYDSGDRIHPNDEGYRVMVEAVAISRLTGSPARTT